MCLKSRNPSLSVHREMQVGFAFFPLKHSCVQDSWAVLPTRVYGLVPYGNKNTMNILQGSGGESPVSTQGWPRPSSAGGFIHFQD